MSKQEPEKQTENVGVKFKQQEHTSQAYVFTKYVSNALVMSIHDGLTQRAMSKQKQKYPADPNTINA